MQGVLIKKSDTLGLYKRKYNVYLERRDEKTGKGPCLKCGRLGSVITRCIDLGQHANLGGKLIESPT